MNATACPCGRNARRTPPAGPRCLACAAEELRRPGPRPDLAELLSPREARALSALRGGRMPATGREATRADVAALAALGLIGEATKARADWLLDVVPAVAPRGWVPPLLAAARLPVVSAAERAVAQERAAEERQPIVPVLPDHEPRPPREMEWCGPVAAYLRIRHATAQQIAMELHAKIGMVAPALSEVGVVARVEREIAVWRRRRSGEHRTCDVVRATVAAYPGRPTADLAAALGVPKHLIRAAAHVVTKGHTR